MGSGFSQSTKQTSQASKKDGMDIFDEFYKEDLNSVEQTPTTPTRTDTQPVKQTTQKPKPSTGFSENGRYVIQVSTVRTKAFAENLAAKLIDMGFPAYVAEVQNPKPELPGTYYRIRIGGFSTTVSAREFGESILKPEGYDYWVDNRANDRVGIDGSGLGSGNSVTF